MNLGSIASSDLLNETCTDDDTIIDYSTEDPELTCFYCKSQFNSTPCWLPCGKTVCKDHLSKICKHKDTIRCPVFSDRFYNKSSIKVAKPVLKQLSKVKFLNLHENILKLLDEIHLIENDSTSVIYKYFEDIIRKFDIKKLDSMLKIGEQFDLINRFIDDLKLNCIENNLPNLEITQNFLNNMIDNSLSLEKNFSVQLDNNMSFEDSEKFILGNIIDWDSFVSKSIRQTETQLVDEDKINSMLYPELREAFNNVNFPKVFKNLFENKPSNLNFICVDELGETFLYDLDFEKQLALFTTQLSSRYIRNMHFNEESDIVNENIRPNNKFILKVLTDQRRLITANDDCNLKIWDLYDENKVKEVCVYKDKEDDDSEIYKISLADKNTILFADRCKLRAWNIEENYFRILDVQMDNYFKYSTEFNFLFTAKERSVYVYKIDPNNFRAQFLRKLILPLNNELFEKIDPIVCISIHSDQFIITGGAFGEIILWTYREALDLHFMKGNDAEMFNNRIIKIKKLNKLEFVCIDTVGYVRKYSIQDNRRLRFDYAIQERGTSINVFKDMFIVKGCIVENTERNDAEYVIKVWEPHTGVCRYVLKGHTGMVNCVRFIRNGYLLSSSDDNTMRMWDIGKSKCVRIIRTPRTVRSFIPYLRKSLLDE